jgi:anti-anti-sigma factor
VWDVNVVALNGSTVVLVTVEGQVDASSADRLCNELLGCLEPPSRLLVIDLAGVTFLDAAAVNVLLLVSRSGTHRGVPVTLVAASHHVQRVLTTLHLDHALSHAASVRDALTTTDEQNAGPRYPSAASTSST